MGTEIEVYNYTIIYKPELQHGKADFSRLSLPGAPKEVLLPGETIHDNLSAAQIKKWTAQDPVLSKRDVTVWWDRV